MGCYHGPTNCMCAEEAFAARDERDALRAEVAAWRQAAGRHEYEAEMAHGLARQRAEKLRTAERDLAEARALLARWLHEKYEEEDATIGTDTAAFLRRDEAPSLEGLVRATEDAGLTRDEARGANAPPVSEKPPRPR